MTRIDKYLWAVRLYKTRSMAAEACKSNKILISKEPVKPSREIKAGDIFEIKKNTAVFTYKVLDELENRVGAPLVKNYLEDLTPSAEIEKQREYLKAKNEFRDFTFGKPSKSDRRKLKKFLGD
ncbi:MAG: RNA-binding S4 domain-containing protein [Crocinitomicaceae bacterium]|nr:RNA-binding S4 domain-containing protein [Crocinitomicaceae bacterium]